MFINDYDKLSILLTKTIKTLLRPDNNQTLFFYLTFFVFHTLKHINTHCLFHSIFQKQHSNQQETVYFTPRPTLIIKIIPRFHVKLFPSCIYNYVPLCICECCVSPPTFQFIYSVMILCHHKHGFVFLFPCFIFSSWFLSHVHPAPSFVPSLTHNDNNNNININNNKTLSEPISAL